MTFLSFVRSKLTLLTRQNEQAEVAIDEDIQIDTGATPDEENESETCHNGNKQLENTVTSYGKAEEPEVAVGNRHIETTATAIDQVEESGFNFGGDTQMENAASISGCTEDTEVIIDDDILVESSIRAEDQTEKLKISLAGDSTKHSLTVSSEFDLAGHLGLETSSGSNDVDVEVIDNGHLQIETVQTAHGEVAKAGFRASADEHIETARLLLDLHEESELHVCEVGMQGNKTDEHIKNTCANIEIQTTLEVAENEETKSAGFPFPSTPCQKEAIPAEKGTPCQKETSPAEKCKVDEEGNIKSDGEKSVVINMSSKESDSETDDDDEDDDDDESNEDEYDTDDEDDDNGNSRRSIGHTINENTRLNDVHGHGTSGQNKDENLSGATYGSNDRPCTMLATSGNNKSMSKYHSTHIGDDKESGGCNRVTNLPCMETFRYHVARKEGHASKISPGRNVKRPWGTKRTSSRDYLLKILEEKKRRWDPNNMYAIRTTSAGTSDSSNVMHVQCNENNIVRGDSTEGDQPIHYVESLRCLPGFKQVNLVQPDISSWSERSNLKSFHLPSARKLTDENATGISPEIPATEGLEVDDIELFRAESSPLLPRDPMLGSMSTLNRSIQSQVDFSDSDDELVFMSCSSDSEMSVGMPCSPCLKAFDNMSLSSSDSGYREMEGMTVGSNMMMAEGAERLKRACIKNTKPLVKAGRNNKGIASSGMLKSGVSTPGATITLNQSKCEGKGLSADGIKGLRKAQIKGSSRMSKTRKRNKGQTIQSGNATKKSKGDRISGLKELSELVRNASCIPDYDVFNPLGFKVYKRGDKRRRAASGCDEEEQHGLKKRTVPVKVCVHTDL